MSRLSEILAVKELGEKIGYGNMMDIASALWSMDLTAIDGKERFGHVPTVLPYLKKVGKSYAKNGVWIRVTEIKYELEKPIKNNL